LFDFEYLEVGFVRNFIIRKIMIGFLQNLPPHIQNQTNWILSIERRKKITDITTKGLVDPILHLKINTLITKQNTSIKGLNALKKSSTCLPK